MSNEIVPANTANKMTTTRPLCLEDIQKYLCPKATEAEAYMFLQLCVNRGLNPFLKEAYLIKYGDTANMVVGKDAFTRKAEESGKLDGFEAGIVILNVEGRMDEREGTIVLKDETLIGGYAKVKRKDMAGEFVNKVSLQEFNRNQGNWKTMPAVMIRKCALVGALREAFTKELGGCYDSAEVAENIEG
jgi:phage recombination protein Bet